MRIDTAHLPHLSPSYRALLVRLQRAHDPTAARCPCLRCYTARAQKHADEWIARRARDLADHPPQDAKGLVERNIRHMYEW